MSTSKSLKTLAYQQTPSEQDVGKPTMEENILQRVLAEPSQVEALTSLSLTIRIRNRMPSQPLH